MKVYSKLINEEKKEKKEKKDKKNKKVPIILTGDNSKIEKKKSSDGCC